MAISNDVIQKYIDTYGGIKNAYKQVIADLASYGEEVDFKTYKQWLVIRSELSKRLDDKDLNEDIELHPNLNPKLWNEDQTLKDDVKEKIEEIADLFIEQLENDGVKIEVDDIYLLGSNANYNYNDDSDLDIHLMADESFDCNQDHLAIIYQAYKKIFNDKYDIKIRGINVEIYVENANAVSNVSTGVYSLKDGWIKDPAKYEMPEIDNKAINRGVGRWIERYQELVANPTTEEVDDYINELYELRKESIIKDGEFGTNNLIFKEVRRRGILDNLKQLKDDLISKDLSIGEAFDMDEEKQEMHRFKYDGPAFDFEDRLLGDFVEVVNAVSEKQALTRINYIIKRKLGYDPKHTIIYLEPQCLNQMDYNPKETTPVDNHSYCEECGAMLNDAGECPVCDLGDEDMLPNKVDN